VLIGGGGGGGANFFLPNTLLKYKCKYKKLVGGKNE